MKIIKAVVGVLRNKSGQLLIAKRQDHQFMAGFWELPGGKIENNENPEETIIRELNEELGIEVREKRITRDEVYIADEAFFTGTAAEVLPIRELDGRKIGSGSRGPLTEKFQTMYFDAVKGRRPQNADWLSAV